MSGLPNLLPPERDEKLERLAARLPEHGRDGLLDYLRHGVPPGHFMRAVLSNDLAEACARADDANRAQLWQYVYVLHNAAPMEAWGSPEKVAYWLARGLEARQKQREARA